MKIYFQLFNDCCPQLIFDIFIKHCVIYFPVYLNFYYVPWYYLRPKIHNFLLYFQKLLARYVSLIPHVSDAVVFPGLCDIWSTCDVSFYKHLLNIYSVLVFTIISQKKVIRQNKKLTTGQSRMTSTMNCWYTYISWLYVTLIVKWK